MKPSDQPRTPRICGLLLLTVFLTASPVQLRRAAAANADEVTRVPVKVMVVNMFQLEAAPWLKSLKISREIAVAGLSSDYPLVRCTADAVCEMTTGMGHSNAAASIMAVAYSGLFDLRKTYFLVAGIAGIDPERGTIGSAAWARFAVDVGIAHEVDARDLPEGWKEGYFGILTASPDQKPRFDYRTEVFRLNEALLQKAIALSKNAQLEDSDDVRAYRQHYGTAPANQPPRVIQCDTATSDAWWAGPHLEQHTRHWVRLLTDSEGVYCTTQQEDNATMNALTRASLSGLVDLQRVVILRTASDFDRPYRGQNTIESLRAQGALLGAIKTSTDNLVLAGGPLVDAIVSHWSQWQDGVPAD
jgi:purine nucleoside permease